MKAIEICKRFEMLVSERKDLDTTLEDVSTYVCLNDGGFFQSLHTENEIKRNHGEVLDSTANNASQLLASKINGNLTSPSTRWFDIVFEQDELNENVQAKEWIEEHIPKGSRIAYELDTPHLWVKPQREFELMYMGTAIVNAPISYYRSRSVDYIVISGELREEVYREAEKYRVPVRRYEILEAEAKLVKSFKPVNNPGPEIEIYYVRE